MTFWVAAPGEGILSLRDPGSNIDNTFPAARQGSYLFRGSGTSQATAVTSAAVALLLQARPSLTPADVRVLLNANGTPLPDGHQMINLNRALGAAVPTYAARTIFSTGDGLLDDARGTTHVASGSQLLSGQNSIFGPFDAVAWAAQTKLHRSWIGGVWMGNRFAGDGWTGTSWAARTWGSANWSGASWTGQTWADPKWSGRYWSGRYWSGRYWSSGDWAGRYWSSEGWAAAAWG
jgi:serine protease AprX